MLRRSSLDSHGNHLSVYEPLESRLLMAISPVIKYIGDTETSAVIAPGEALHVDATFSNFDGNLARNCYIEWEFGDPAGSSSPVSHIVDSDDHLSFKNPNKMPGFNAAHIYDTPGTFTVTLSITNPSGATTTNVTRNIVVQTPATSKTVYVSALGNDANNGETTGAAVKTIARAEQLLAAHKAADAARPVSVLFHGGHTFTSSEARAGKTGYAATETFELGGYQKVKLGSYNLGSARPLIRWTPPGESVGFISGNASSRWIQIQDLKFDNISDNLWGDVIRLTGGADQIPSNWTIRNNEVDDGQWNQFFQQDAAEGQVLSGNIIGEMDTYFAYAGGGAVGEIGDYTVLMGNRAEEALGGHNVRQYSNKFLAYGNDFTNGAGSGSSRNTLRHNNGQWVYYARNALRGGVVTITGSATDQIVKDAIVDGNILYLQPSTDAGVRMSITPQAVTGGTAGASDGVIIRNNVIEYQGARALEIITSDAPSGSYNGARNVFVLNNTFIHTGTGDAGAIKISGSGAGGVTLRNNLQYASNAAYVPGTNKYALDIRNPGTDSANVNAKVTLVGAVNGNIWYTDDDTAGREFSYVWKDATAGASGKRTLAEWNVLQANDNTTFADSLKEVALSGFDPTSGNVAANRINSVFVDLYGNRRPISGSATNAWTAGAVELNQDTLPEAPEFIDFYGISPTSIYLSWSDNANNETSYRVEAEPASFVGTTVTQNLPANTTSATITGLMRDEAYVVRVIAINSVGESPVFNYASTSLFDQSDIGTPTPAPAGTQKALLGRYEVTAGGTDIFGTADNFNFLHHQLSGDFDYKVRLNSFTKADGTAADLAAKAGIMARESLAAGSRHVTMAATPANAYRFHARTSTNGSTSLAAPGQTAGSNTWVRLRRVGNQFMGYYSDNGSDWTLAGVQTLSSLASTIYVGLATASHVANQAVKVDYQGFGTAAGGWGSVIINGTSNADTINVSRSGSNVNVAVNGTTTSYPIDEVSWLTLDAGGGNDTLTVNFAGGDPLPINGIAFTGGSGDDTLISTAALASDAFSVEDNRLVNATTRQIAFATTEILTLDKGAYAVSEDLLNLKLNVNSTAAATFNTSQHLAALNINGGVATMATHGSRVLVTSGLSISSTGKLDLKDNDMILRSTSANKVADQAMINSYLTTGFDGGGTEWTGNGITSSTAQSNPYYYSLGFFLNDDAGLWANMGTTGGSAIYTSFAGETVGVNDVLVKFTYGGDANLDGIVSGDDYSHIDGAIGLGLSDPGWINGDFNYDGVVDAADYGVIDNTIQLQGDPL